MLSFGQKLKFKKTCKKRLEKDIRVLPQEKGFKKHLIFENLHVFKNRQNWSECMGHNLCKMLSLGKKIKIL